jgi:predicted pyridoxine 5'-phosphate oxidase superfamily flavin-nucleotide-binding protein
MSRAYADIAFTAAVRACQTQMGSRHAYEALDRSPDRRDTLTAQEADFIHARDGFYQASVSETGWPYVQYRGGPPGFLHVLDGKTMAYADFRGNRQYISTGNPLGNDRIALFLMDYANQRRLKVMGRVCQVNEDEALLLLPRLLAPNYPAPVERVVKISVEAYDWNCPKHITPRFTESEIVAAVAPLHAEIARLQLALKNAETHHS